MADITCNPGYYLEISGNSSVTVTCTNLGRWSPIQLPACIKRKDMTMSDLKIGNKVKTGNTQ